jgi:hypothetical protein
LIEVRKAKGIEMDHHIKEYFCQYSEKTPRGNFHKVIPLHESLKQITGDWVKKNVPNFCKGWYELMHLTPQDRIEFIRDYWMTKLPYHPELTDFLNQFFNSLDDIGIFITQKKFDDPYEANMVYSIKGNAGFFRGGLPISDEALEDIKATFLPSILPADYLSFLEIHDGFGKTTDCTGMTQSKALQAKYDDFQKMLTEIKGLSTNKGKPVDPKTLIPFYESFGMPFYQCFWSEWYPQDEMGNVYFSGLTKSISDVDGKDPSAEGMAFPTFVDWLMFYMEKIG